MSCPMSRLIFSGYHLSNSKAKNLTRSSNVSIDIQVVAVSTLQVGLTGSKVAKLMLQNQWYLFGIPPVFTSDLGSHFVSSWWQMLHSSNGVRLAYGQGYHRQSNGSAERAGFQIIDRLIKWKVQRKGLSMFEMLPILLSLLHDTPG